MEQVLDNASNTNMREESVRKVLCALNIKPTNQRIDIAKFILIKDQHLSAEDIFSSLNDSKHGISRATVYNTLNLFADKGLGCVASSIKCFRVSINFFLLLAKLPHKIKTTFSV